MYRAQVSYVLLSIWVCRPLNDKIVMVSTSSCLYSIRFQYMGSIGSAKGRKQGKIIGIYNGDIAIPAQFVCRCCVQ